MDAVIAHPLPKEKKCHDCQEPNEHPKRVGTDVSVLQFSQTLCQRACAGRQPSTNTVDYTQVNRISDELSEGFVFEQQGNSLNIEDKMPRHYNGSNDKGSQLTIKMPKTVKLSADTISANLQVAEAQGELDLNTVSGDIKANNLSGKPELHTVSGDIITQALDGKVKLETVSGTIQDTDSKGEMNYRLVSGDLKSQTQAEKVTVEQVSGEVNANLSLAKEIVLRTVSGDSKVSLAKNFNRANLESVSGDIIVTFADMPDASFDLDGGPGGKIKNTLTQDEPKKQKYVPRAELSFQTGSGAASVKMNTISGDLVLKKQ